MLPGGVIELVRLLAMRAQRAQQALRHDAQQGGLQQVDAGPKGAVVTFRKNQFANPEGLVNFMARSKGVVRLQPDHKLVFRGEWDQSQVRFKGVRALVSSLAAIAAKGAKAA